jgi:hypothetical protein
LVYIYLLNNQNKKEKKEARKKWKGRKERKRRKGRKKEKRGYKKIYSFCQYSSQKNFKPCLWLNTLVSIKICFQKYLVILHLSISLLSGFRKCFLFSTGPANLPDGQLITHEFVTLGSVSIPCGQLLT